MSDTINKQKILDDVVAVSSQVNMGVLYGAQNVTSQVFKAIPPRPHPLCSMSWFLQSRQFWTGG